MARVLIVDDEPTICRLVRAALETEGHEVLEAGDGVLGLSLAKLEQPDLVLLDLALPRMSGLEVARHLQQDSHVSSIPVLFLTGLVPEAEREPALHPSSSSVIAKPFSPDLLVRRVSAVLSAATV